MKPKVSLKGPKGVGVSKPFGGRSYVGGFKNPSTQGIHQLGRSAEEMQKKRIAAGVSLLILTILLGIGPRAARPETEPKSLTVVYSNNINGEIEPCPT